MKQIIILMLGVILTSSVIAQKNTIEKENFMIIYNTCKDLNAEICLINTSSTFLSDHILLSNKIFSTSVTSYDYKFKYGKPVKDEASEKIKEYKYSAGVINGEHRLGSTGEFLDVETIVAKKVGGKVIEIIKYKYNGEDIKYRFFFTYNDYGQITEKKELMYNQFYYMNGVTHSEITKYEYTPNNKLKSCSISKIEKNIEEEPYIICKWEYGIDGMLIKEILSMDFFEIQHYLYEYNNNKYGWTEKKSYKGNPKTKEWELNSITYREYIDENAFKKQQEELKKQQKRSLLLDFINSISSYYNLSYWDDKTIKKFNSNKKLTYKQFETLLSSNKTYLCLKTDIISKYRKETKRIAKEYQYSNGEPIKYENFSLSELDKTISLFTEDVLELIDSIVSDLDKFHEYEIQLKNDISANDNIINELYLVNGKVEKRKLYIFKTYTEYKETNKKVENIERLEAKKIFQDKVILLAKSDTKHLNKSLKKVENLDDRVTVILDYK